MAVVAVTGVESPNSLSQSWLLIIFGVLMKRQSSPRSSILLLLGSCSSSQIVLLMCFQCKILLSDVVAACSAPDIAS